MAVPSTSARAWSRNTVSIGTFTRSCRATACAKTGVSVIASRT